jgi:hypothetical protein
MGARSIKIIILYLGALHTTAVGLKGPRTNSSQEDKVEVH